MKKSTRTASVPPVAQQSPLLSPLGSQSRTVAPEICSLGQSLAIDPTGDIFGEYSTFTDNDIIMTTTAPWNPDSTSGMAFEQHEEGEDAEMDDYESALADFDCRLEAARTIDHDGNESPTSIIAGEDSPACSPLRLRGGVVEEGLRKEPYVVHFGGCAGKVYPTSTQLDGHGHYASQLLNSDTHPWAPFGSEREYMFSEWAKLRGPGSTAVSELLAIPGVINVLSCILHCW